MEREESERRRQGEENIRKKQKQKQMKENGQLDGKVKTENQLQVMLLVTDLILEDRSMMLLYITVICCKH